MGARAKQKAATIAAVRAAAAKLFRAKGYDAVGMRDVAAACGRSTGAVFAHFSNKVDLYEAAMGKPPPDVVGFLERLEGMRPGEAHGLSAMARELRQQLVGEAA